MRTSTHGICSSRQLADLDHVSNGNWGISTGIIQTTGSADTDCTGLVSSSLTSAQAAQINSPNMKNTHKATMTLVIGVAVGVGAPSLIGIAVGAWWCTRRRKAQRQRKGSRKGSTSSHDGRTHDTGHASLIVPPTMHAPQSTPTTMPSFVMDYAPTDAASSRYSPSQDFLSLAGSSASMASSASSAPLLPDSPYLFPMPPRGVPNGMRRLPAVPLPSVSEVPRRAVRPLPLPPGQTSLFPQVETESLLHERPKPAPAPAQRGRLASVRKQLNEKVQHLRGLSQTAPPPYDQASSTDRSP